MENNKKENNSEKYLDENISFKIIIYYIFKFIYLSFIKIKILVP